MPYYAGGDRYPVPLMCSNSIRHTSSINQKQQQTGSFPCCLPCILLPRSSLVIGKNVQSHLGPERPRSRDRDGQDSLSSRVNTCCSSSSSMSTKSPDHTSCPVKVEHAHLPTVPIAAPTALSIPPCHEAERYGRPSLGEQR